MLEQRNLFTTKHFWTVIGLFYVTSCQPAIDAAIDGRLTNKDIGHLASAAVATIFGAALKLSEENIYTPKGIIGRDKENTTEQPNVTETIQPIESAVSIIAKDPTLNTVADVINPIGLLGKSSGESSAQEQNTTGLYIKALQETWLKVRPVDSSILEDTEKLELKADEITHITSYKNPIDNHIEIQAGSRKWYTFVKHVELYKDGSAVSFSTVFMPTKEQLEEIYQNTLTDALYIDFKTCLQTFDITTPEDISAFIAQTGHESAGLIYTQELASGNDYEGRTDLGNTEEGDGRKYKGAGFIQLTGRANYQALSDYLHDPKVMDGVEYVAAKYPFTSAGFWWYNNNMSGYIAQGADIYAVTERVNGGQNGIDDRIAYYQKAKEVLGLV